jgi:pimeloyl-ACP methyl ester carboxylesterase
MPRSKLVPIIEKCSSQSYDSQDNEKDGKAGLQTAAQSQNVKWIWRTPLMLSKQYWEGWFTGLSDAFLSIPCPKILILAGTDRLDTTLMVAQMQGKFQMVLISKAGHVVHEDEPQEVALTIHQFIKRHRLLNNTTSIFT